MTAQALRASVVVIAIACATLTAGCKASRPSSGSPSSPLTLAPPDGHGLQPVTMPDFSSMQPSVRKQMETQFSALNAAVEHRASSREELAANYGEMGKLLMAATFLDAAETCFADAEALAPEDRRWPYYLGQIYKAKGPTEKSIAAFQRAQQLAPSDVPTMVALGDAELAAGRADDANRQFAQALQRQPSLAAARYGAGRAALAQRQYQRAVDELTQALALDPHATSVHYSLAMAYRGLGDVRQSEAHLAQQGKVDPRRIDPLMREIDELLESPEAYNLRGGAELDAGHWEAAAQLFRKGLELSPNEPSLRQRLGTALYQMGDARGAMQQFEEVLGRTPDYARAHFSLGVLLSDAHQYADAVEHFRAALKSEPRYVEAHVQLAGVLARTDRPGEAVEQFKQALDIDPTNSDAAFGRAMALIRLRRYADARDALTEGMAAHPDQPMYAHALARVLAAAPDDRVRDGRRALALIDQLVKGAQTIELAETTAMALAESRRYREAVSVQREALTAAASSGSGSAERRIRENLRLYESGRPCRTPFADDELP